jgi:NAD(P)-dependent dehydrogenase (short-subunit alcohol dehydrogenase family)
LDLTEKVALITGAKRVGATVAVAIAAEGADIALAYARSRDEAEAAADDVRARGRRAIVVHADVTEPADAAALAETVSRTLGRINVLVNMASMYRSVPFDELTPEAWDAQLAVDLRGSFLCAKAVVPILRKQGGGRIINFTDWVAPSGRPRYKGYLAYYVAKAGVKALTEALALELASDNILVNAIAPGPVLAPDDLSEDQKLAVETATPLGRWGGADEIAKVVLSLVESDFITGETIRVDGGRHVY